MTENQSTVAVAVQADEERPGDWEHDGDWSYRLVMADPFVRLSARRRTINGVAPDKAWRWDVTVGWPGVCALMVRDEAADGAEARAAAEAAARALIDGIAGRAREALAALGASLATRCGGTSEEEPEKTVQEEHRC